MAPMPKNRSPFFGFDVFPVDLPEALALSSLRGEPQFLQNENPGLEGVPQFGQKAASKSLDEQCGQSAEETSASLPQFGQKAVSLNDLPQLGQNGLSEAVGWPQCAQYTVCVADITGTTAVDGAAAEISYTGVSTVDGASYAGNAVTG